MPHTAARPIGQRDRILDAALGLIAQRGVTRTSLVDVARQADCGRATVYRTFPGGKAQLFEQVMERELAGFSEDLGRQLDLAASLEDALVVAITESGSFVLEHRALQFVLAHEPGVVLPYLGFGRVERLYEAAGLLAGPHLVRFLEPDQTPWAIEWVVRLVVSYLFAPADDVDLTTDADARRLVRTYLLPALDPAHDAEAATIARQPISTCTATTGS